MRTWTKPYCGVSHMEIPRQTGYQFSVTDRGSCADGTVIPLRNRPFRNATEKRFPSAAEARAWLESQAEAPGLS